jgi:hypothetical protein
MLIKQQAGAAAYHVLVGEDGAVRHVTRQARVIGTLRVVQQVRGSEMRAPHTRYWLIKSPGSNHFLDYPAVRQCRIPRGWLVRFRERCQAHIRGNGLAFTAVLEGVRPRQCSR